MNTTFKKKKYLVCKTVISKEISNFLYQYLLLKRHVASTMFNEKFISPFTSYFGRWDDPQVPNTYSHYGDIATETLLANLLPKVQKITGLNLTPNYSYSRIYKKGDELKRHKDRPSCEISTTINLGGDNWSIYLEPSGEVGKKGIKVDLKQGDMLIYLGCELEHWRKPFKGKNCSQVFLHYNNKKHINASENLFDTRPHLGLPADFKK